MKDSPKIFAMLPLVSTSSVSPVSRCQALPNSAFEYHRPPSRKQATAATTTAIQLISGMSASLVVVAGLCAGSARRLGKMGNGDIPRFPANKNVPYRRTTLPESGRSRRASSTGEKPVKRRNSLMRCDWS